MSSAWVAGEVLVDLIPALDGDEVIDETRYRAVVGGGAANTARALARLGKAAEFVGGLSSDRFGHMAWMELERDGVGLDLVLESDAPTARAIVAIGDDGSASYRFEVEGSVTFDFRAEWLPEGSPKVIHVGTLATVVAPGRNELFGWVRDQKSSGAVVVFDPNVRSVYLEDRVRYRENVEEWIGLSSVVKASDEDAKWLYPELDCDEVASRWLEMGPKLVVITRGARGMVGYRDGESIDVEGVQVDLVDSVGAGDTVGAVLVEALLDGELEALSGKRLKQVLLRASHAAAITCSRQGANPPTLRELEESLGRIENRRIEK